MRQLFSLIALSIISITTLQAQRNKVHWSELDNNRGKIYQRNHIEPFSGTAFDEHEPGKKKGLIPFKDGLMHGKAIQWDRKGNKISETTYVKGKREGREIVYYPNGKKQAIINYANDKPQGLVIEYFDTGEKMSSGELVNGVENGRYTWWFKNGLKDQELNYRMGSVEGAVRNWYPDGKQKMISEYKSNQKNGKTVNWFANGNMMSKQFYYKGTEIDTSSFWTKESRLKEQKIYNQRGNLVDHRSFQEASILTKKGYLHVFNKLNSNFILPLEGKTVDPVNAKILAFYIDGVLVQVYTAPKSAFSNQTKSDLELLQNHQEFDIDRLEAMLSDDSIKYTLEYQSEELKTQKGETALFWNFNSPGNSSKKQLTLVQEQYLSIVCQNHILLLNGLVFKKNKPEAVKAALMKLANAVILKDKPIDVIDLSEKSVE